VAPKWPYVFRLGLPICLTTQRWKNVIHCLIQGPNWRTCWLFFVTLSFVCWMSSREAWIPLIIVVLFYQNQTFQVLLFSPYCAEVVTSLRCPSPVIASRQHPCEDVEAVANSLQRCVRFGGLWDSNSWPSLTSTNPVPKSWVLKFGLKGFPTVQKDIFVTSCKTAIPANRLSHPV